MPSVRFLAQFKQLVAQLIHRSGPNAWSGHRQDKGLGPKVVAGNPAGGDSGLWMRAYDSLIHIKYSRKEIGKKEKQRKEGTHESSRRKM
jgi:hypothetical protein